MKVNTDKFEYMVFGKHEGTYNIKIRDHVIESVDNVKILGLHIDSKLNFDTHISKVCKKTGRQVQVMSRLKIFLVKVIKFYFITALWNAILTTVLLYGIFVLKLTV